MERLVLKRYSHSGPSRIGAAVTLKALGVLLRDHPKTALDMAGAGLAQAGKSGFKEIKNALLPSHEEAATESAQSDKDGIHPA